VSHHVRWPSADPGTVPAVPQRSLPDGLERLPADTELDKLADVLRRDGGVVIEGFIGTSSVRSIAGQLDPYIERRDPGFRHHGDGSFYGGNTKRLQGLAVKSPTFVEEVLLSDVLLGLADRILLQSCGDYWMSQAETIYIGPGNTAQALHRDDINWSHAATLGIDLQVSALVALGDYDADVGATMVVPGSSGRPLDEPIDAALARPVELEPGDALVYLGNLVHGGGANVTTDRWRKALYIGYLLGWLTPEEAVARSITADVAARLPHRARELLGWATIHGNTLSDGPASALQLWQLDADDLGRFDGLFIDRS
jgi:ectoine hydroxylase-related dioxygenase (phytanoyl-CoA dioxygenase family)